MFAIYYISSLLKSFCFCKLVKFTTRFQSSPLDIFLLLFATANWIFCPLYFLRGSSWRKAIDCYKQSLCFITHYCVELWVPEVFQMTFLGCPPLTVGSPSPLVFRTLHCPVPPWIYSLFVAFFLSIFFAFVGLHPWYMEVPRPGVESEL